MEPLPTIFKKNGLIYTIAEKSATRYLASLVSEESGNLVGYETGRIIQGKEADAIMDGVPVKFKAKERIPGNENFGRDDYEICVSPKSKDQAYKAFTEGTLADATKIQ